MLTITIECSHQEAHFNLVLGPGRDGNSIAYLLKDEDEESSYYEKFRL